MAIQANPIITPQKRQLKCGGCTTIGRTIKSRPLNFGNVQGSESAAIRDCFRQRKIQYNVMWNLF